MALETKLVWYGEDKKRDINEGTIKALIRAGDLVKRDAKLLVSVDKGLLRSSIFKKLYKSQLTEVVFTKIEYASYVEFGLRSNPNYPIQPYMRPALNNNKENIRNIFIQEERAAVDK